MRLSLTRTFFVANVVSLLLIILFILNLNLSSNPEPTFTLKNKVEIFSNDSDCPPEGKYYQEDPCLIRHVKQKLLLPPSGLPLNLPPDNSHLYPGITEQNEFIVKHFIRRGKSLEGFFIECRENDGEFISTTLDLERKYHWKGLLVERNSGRFQKLFKMHRNAWAINQGLCTTNHSDQVRLYHDVNEDAGTTGIGRFWKTSSYSAHADVTCVPLYTILLALNVTTVDYLSLDVQGLELDILKTVPLDKVIFKVVSLRHEKIPGFQSAAIKFLEVNGYWFIGTVLDKQTKDSMFVHETEYTPDMTLRVKYHYAVSSLETFRAEMAQVVWFSVAMYVSVFVLLLLLCCASCAYKYCYCYLEHFLPVKANNEIKIC